MPASKSSKTRSTAGNAITKTRATAASKAVSLVRTAATSLTKQTVAIAEQLMALRATFTDEAGKPAVGGTYPDAYKEYVRAHITGPLEREGVPNIDSVMELANRHIRKPQTKTAWYGSLVKAGTITQEHYKQLMTSVLGSLAPRQSADGSTKTDENKAERDRLAAALQTADVLSHDEVTKATATRKAAKRSAPSQLRADVGAATKTGIDVAALLGTIRQSLRLIYAETDDGAVGKLADDVAASKLAAGTIENYRQQTVTIGKMVADLGGRLETLSNVVSIKSAESKRTKQTAGSNRGGRSTGTKQSTKPTRKAAASK